MSSYHSILGGYTSNNLCDQIDPWLDILDHFNSAVTEDEIWQVARESERFPLIENIIQSLVINRLESVFIEQAGCEWDDVEFESYVNCLDTHFSINGTPIMEEQDFYDQIEAIQSAVLH